MPSRKKERLVEETSGSHPSGASGKKQDHSGPAQRDGVVSRTINKSVKENGIVCLKYTVQDDANKTMTCLKQKSGRKNKHTRVSGSDTEEIEANRSKQSDESKSLIPPPAPQHYPIAYYPTAMAVAVPVYYQAVNPQACLPPTYGTQACFVQENPTKLGRIRNLGLKFGKPVSKSMLQAELSDAVNSGTPSVRVSQNQPPPDIKSNQGTRSSHRKKGSYKLFSSPTTTLQKQWHCYRCGKVRSRSFQTQHSMTAKERPQANWCYKCRMWSMEVEQHLVYKGNPAHFCWSCGIIRSGLYHLDNPLGWNEKSDCNFCAMCRSRSPAEVDGMPLASEVGNNDSPRVKLSRVVPSEDGFEASSEGSDPSQDDVEQMTDKVQGVRGKSRLRSKHFLTENKLAAGNSSGRLDGMHGLGKVSSPNHKSYQAKEYRPPSCESEHSSGQSELLYRGRARSQLETETPHDVRGVAHGSDARHTGGAKLGTTARHAKLSKPRASATGRDEAMTDGVKMNGTGRNSLLDNTNPKAATTSNRQSDGSTYPAHIRVQPELASGVASVSSVKSARSWNRPPHSRDHPRHLLRDPAVISTRSPPERLRSRHNSLSIPYVGNGNSLQTDVDPFIGEPHPMNHGLYRNTLRRYDNGDNSRAASSSWNGPVHDGPPLTSFDEWPADHGVGGTRRLVPDAYLSAGSTSQFGRTARASQEVNGAVNTNHGSHGYHRAETGPSLADNAMPLPYDYAISEPENADNMNIHDRGMHGLASPPTSMDHMSPRKDSPAIKRAGQTAPIQESPGGQPSNTNTYSFDFARFNRPAPHNEDMDEFYNHVPNEEEWEWMDECRRIFMEDFVESVAPTSPQEETFEGLVNHQEDSGSWTARPRQLPTPPMQEDITYPVSGLGRQIHGVVSAGHNQDLYYQSRSRGGFHSKGPALSPASTPNSMSPTPSMVAHTGHSLLGTGRHGQYW